MDVRSGGCPSFRQSLSEEVPRLGNPGLLPWGAGYVVRCQSGYVNAREKIAGHKKRASELVPNARVRAGSYLDRESGDVVRMVIEQRRVGAERLVRGTRATVVVKRVE